MYICLNFSSYFWFKAIVKTLFASSRRSPQIVVTFVAIWVNIRLTFIDACFWIFLKQKVISENLYRSSSKWLTWRNHRAIFCTGYTSFSRLDGSGSGHPFNINWIQSSYGSRSQPLAGLPNERDQFHKVSVVSMKDHIAYQMDKRKSCNHWLQLQ